MVEPEPDPPVVEPEPDPPVVELEPDPPVVEPEPDPPVVELEPEPAEPAPPMDTAKPAPTPISGGRDLGVFTTEDVTEIQAAYDAADHLLMGGVSLRITDLDGYSVVKRLAAPCNANHSHCWHEYEPKDPTSGANLDDFHTTDAPLPIPSGDPTKPWPPREHRGPVFDGAGSILERGKVTIGVQKDADYTRLHGWMDHAHFGVTIHDSYVSKGVDSIFAKAFAGYSNWHIVSNSSAVNNSTPLVSATWNGHMVGLFNFPGYLGVPVRGNVTLTYDQPNTALNARFHDVVEMRSTSGNTLDFSYGPANVTPEGFIWYDDTKGITGNFYGPNQEEVIGYFFINPIEGVDDAIMEGVYGAAKQ